MTPYSVRKMKRMKNRMMKRKTMTQKINKLMRKCTQSQSLSKKKRKNRQVIQKRSPS